MRTRQDDRNHEPTTYERRPPTRTVRSRPKKFSGLKRLRSKAKPSFPVTPTISKAAQIEIVQPIAKKLVVEPLQVVAAVALLDRT